jgi:hypothetical protein
MGVWAYGRMGVWAYGREAKTQGRCDQMGPMRLMGPMGQSHKSHESHRSHPVSEPSVFALRRHADTGQKSQMSYRGGCPAR